MRYRYKLKQYILLFLFVCSFLLFPFKVHADNATYSTLEGKGWVQADANTWTKSDDQGNVLITLKTNGNVWEYYFHVDDPQAIYYAWEDDVPEGYSIVDDKGARPTPITINHKDKADDVITNQRGKHHTGNILLTKKVEKPVNDKSFHFTVTLSNTDADAAKLISGSTSFGTVPFKNGVGRIDLKADETVMITGIPEGTAYTITEDASDKYETSFQTNTGTNVDGRTITGTIASGSNSTVSIVCHNNGHDLKIPGSFTVTKTVINGLPTDTFQFTAAFWQLEGDATYEAVITKKDGSSEDKSFKSTGSGTAAFKFTLSDGDQIKFDGIPEGAQYQIKEEESEGYNASYKMSGDIQTVVTEEDSNSSAGSLSTGRETQEAITSSGQPENAVIAFTNEKTGGFAVKKAVIDGVDTDTFHFRAALWNLKPSTEYKGVKIEKDGSRSEITYKAGPSGIGTVEFDLTDGAEVDFTGLSKNVQYQVAEDASENYTASYAIENGDDGKNAYKNTSLTTQKETVVADASNGLPTFTKIVFTNTGDMTETTGGLTVTKAVENGTKRAQFEYTAEFSGLKAGKTYNVTHTDKDQNEESDTFTAASDGTADYDFLLKDGEKEYFDGLPVGSKYQVTEVSSKRYIASYQITGEGIKTVKDSDANTNEDSPLATAVETLDKAADGSAESATIAFKNTANKGDETHGNLTVIKKNENGDPDDAFAFEAEFKGLRMDKDYTATIERKDGTTQDLQITPTLAQTGYLSFGLSDGDKITFKSLPKNATWKVTETGSEGYMSSYSVTDAAVIAKETDSATVSGSDLSTAEEKVDVTADKVTLENSTVTFTNRKVGSFDVVKTVKGKEGDTDSFHFDTKLSSLDGSKTYTAEKTKQDGSKENIMFKTDADGNSDVKFDLKDKEKVTFKDIPVGGKYQITETGTVYYESSYEISGSGVNAEEYIRTSEGEAQDLSTQTETVDNGESAQVTFTNSYHDHKTETVKLDVEKNWKDEENEEGLRPESVKIHLLRTWSGNTGEPEEVDSVELNSGNDWKHTFEGLLKYRPEQDTDPYIYTVREDDVDNYKSEVNYTDKEDGSRTAVVTNSIYHPHGSLLIKKQVEGDRAEYDKPFQFVITLKNVDGSPVSGVFQLDTEKGTVEGEVEFDETGTGMVDVADEETACIAGIPANASYTVEETDYPLYKTELMEGTSWKGTITEDTDSLVSVKNTYVGKVDLTVEKKVTGNMGDKSKQFHFELTLSHDAEMERDHEWSIPTPDTLKAEKNGEEMTLTGKDGVFSFTLSHGDSIKIKDIDAYLTYSINETDSTGYKVSVREQTQGSQRWGEMKNADDPRILDESRLVEYTNDKHGFIPTGVNPQTTLWFIIPGVAALIFIILRMKKRHPQDQ